MKLRIRLRKWVVTENITTKPYYRRYFSYKKAMSKLNELDAAGHDVFINRHKEPRLHYLQVAFNKLSWDHKENLRTEWYDLHEAISRAVRVGDCRQLVEFIAQVDSYQQRYLMKHYLAVYYAISDISDRASQQNRFKHISRRRKSRKEQS